MKRKKLYEYRVFTTGLTLQKFADKIGIALPTYAEIEKGRTKRPETVTLKKIADTFDLTPEQMENLMQIEE